MDLDKILELIEELRDEMRRLLEKNEGIVTAEDPCSDARAKISTPV